MASAVTHDATGAVPVDPAELRADVQAKYRQNARHPDAGFHSHTERHVALRCRYNVAAMDAPVAVESLASRWCAVCRLEDDVRRRRTGGEANARGLDVQGVPFHAVKR
jgi:hypothetical protein